MKVTVDIPDSIDLSKVNDIKLYLKYYKDNNEYSYVTDGFAIQEERPQGDLISRSALKEAIKSYADDQYAENEYLGEYAIMNIIDNAPTVEPDISEIEEKFWHRCGFLQGYTTGLKDKERLQGEWIDYDNTFYKCPDCGYLLEKCCPQCQNKVILPKGGAE